MELNLLDDEGWIERTWPPERDGYRWRRKRVAGEHLGASLYDPAPGESTFRTTTSSGTTSSSS